MDDKIRTRLAIGSILSCALLLCAQMRSIGIRDTMHIRSIPLKFTQEELWAVVQLDIVTEENYFF